MTKPHEPLAELEQLRRRVEVLERVVRLAVPSLAIYRCPSHVRLKDVSVCPPRNDGGEGCQACWTAALAQAEGGGGELSRAG